MIPFSLELPRSIVFGAGSLRAAAERLRGFGRRVLVVSGSRWFAGSGLKRRVEEMLGGFLLEHLSCPAGEPTTDSLAEACSRARAFSPDAVLGIGGGSVLDTAKAVSVLIHQSGRIEEYLEGVEGAKPIQRPGTPWIAVPTTAGTGAEATKNAVVKSTALGVKRSIRSAFLMARTAIVDPELTLDLPLSLTGTSGLDALTQLTEAYVSRRSTPPIRAIVHQAFPLMLEALRGLPGRLDDVDLRSDAAYGALMSGIALTNAGLGAAHGFAAGVGGAYEIPHGLICAIFLPLVLEANASVIRGAIEELVSGRSGSRDPVEWLAETVRDLLGAYGLPKDLRGFGIPRSRVPELCELSSGTSMKANPRDLSGKELEDLLTRVI
jgi:alcohol dehydrogenase class IV